MSDNARQPVLDETLKNAPTTHAKLLAWVAEVSELTQPDSVYWVDGSEAEYKQLTDELVEAGTLKRLNPELFPNSFAGSSDPKDVARV
jgi:phosphoenolpyruvate carboxykinase (GTP)